MDKEDLYIKEKLQEDKIVSSKADQVFKNFKGGEKMIDKEKKVIIINFNKFLAIAASLVIIGFIGINLYANSIGKPNVVSAIQALLKKEPEENTDEIAKELFEKATLLLRDTSRFYEPAEPEEVKKIKDKYYKKITSTYSEIEEKFGEIFTEEALKNAISEFFVDLDGTLYAIPIAGPGYTIENIEAKKINEEYGELTYEAIYIKKYVDGADEEKNCRFKMKKVEGEYRISATDYLDMDKQKEIKDTEKDKNNSDDLIDTTSIYKKYEGLYWLFNNESSQTEYKWMDDKIVIENGIVYLEKGKTKNRVVNIKENAKFLIGWGEQTLQRVYVLTEEGNVWKSEIETIESDDLNSNFEKISLPGKVINMTNGNSEVRTTEPPYFLLLTGELVNEQGNKYEELNGNFIKSFGNVYSRIYVGKDNSIFYYNRDTRNYIQIKDENGKVVKMRDAFIQWSTIYNNLITESRRRRQITYFN